LRRPAPALRGLSAASSCGRSWRTRGHPAPAAPLTGEHRTSSGAPEPAGALPAALERGDVGSRSPGRAAAAATAEAPSVVTVLTHAPHASQPSARRVSPVVAPTRPRSRACSSVPAERAAQPPARQSRRKRPQRSRRAPSRPRASASVAHAPQIDPGLRVLRRRRGPRSARRSARATGKAARGRTAPAARAAARRRRRARRCGRVQRIRRPSAASASSRSRRPASGGRRGGGHVEQAAEPGDGDARFEREGRSGEPRRAGRRKRVGDGVRPRSGGFPPAPRADRASRETPGCSRAKRVGRRRRERPSRSRLRATRRRRRRDLGHDHTGVPEYGLAPRATRRGRGCRRRRRGRPHAGASPPGSCRRSAPPARPASKPSPRATQMTPTTARSTTRAQGALSSASPHTLRPGASRQRRLARGDSCCRRSPSDLARR